ncbi:type IV secretory pathway, VirB4 component [Klebsiella michiganensis]|uniref:conjugative transfer ATPase n=1 Tax=Klebsiella michiganensis TaxID=1134687 RepID=UPI000DFE1424|nr:conjugative transfer ATPase [Klebsiella michiganensis]MBA8306150.1 conjugative transfer ATPase [Klebsiella michiganensis]MBW5931910.1 conjugative transfer ATPase [Klebsiella michiganensis]MBW5933815.1 conjugative transfer ATPase [Klebsiella michiganensis]MBX4818565.1 conjugative transfer ATPase [Klebsiella michiganensis]QLP35712.1 conjugative transfer ATPase [Klebsiella michiganensis]
MRENTGRPRSGKLTQQAANAAYQKGPSFADLLPWVEFQDDSQTLLLDDGRSVAAIYDITPVGTEGRSRHYLEDVRDIVKDALQDSFDETDMHPWVIQFFCQNEDDFSGYMQKLRDYVTPAAKGSAFSEAWLGEMDRHLRGITRSGGLFLDDVVTKTPWRGQIRRSRMVVYRYLPAKMAHGDQSPEQALNNVCERLVSALAGAGLTACRQNRTDISRWLVLWLNPAPVKDDRQAFYSAVTEPDLPETGVPPVVNDFAENLLFSEPVSDAEKGLWYFDNLPHKVIVVDRLRKAPQPGHLTGETRRGDAVNALFDLLPESTVMSLTMIVHPQDLLEAHLNRLADRAIGENVDSEYTKSDCREVKTWLKDGHKMYRSTLAFYLSASDISALNKQNRELNSVLLNAGLVPVQDGDEVVPLSSYLRWLPANFDPARDKRNLYTRLNFVQHIANLLPVFGRETGTGHPGISYFNRGGTPLDFDPLNKDDRSKNGHLLLLGPTGAGKSATLNGKIAQLMALHRPRLFIVEAGNSFGLTADYAKRYGLTVNKISLKPGSGVTLPLFAEAWRLVEEPVSADIPDDEEQPEQDGDDQRDILGEMEITARLMITGGEVKEDARLTRPDRAMIRQAILDAARICYQAKRQTLTQDVRDALFTSAKDPTLPENRRSRAYEMAESMNMFCSGFEGELFNREGEPWPDADITLVDLATFAREGYEAQLAIAYISLINHINNIGERDQHLSRSIVNITDESHIITVNPLLARFLTKGSKMWRKLGIWLWLATQNLSDFPDDAKKLLNMIEWWELLVMPPEEVEQLERFKNLTKEQKQLLLSATKASGKYTEGVVLATKIEALFRVVPPSLFLALGMTEKHEKAERAQLMRELGISELDAAIRVARRIDRARGLVA